MSFTSQAAPHGHPDRPVRRSGPSTGRQARGAAKPLGSSGTALRRAGFAAGAAATDALVIVVSALLAGLAYRQDATVAQTTLAGVVVALLFVATSTLGRAYDIPTYLSLKGHAENAFKAWLSAFGAALTLGFLTKTTAIFSRGASGILFVGGFAALMLLRTLLARHMRRRAETGAITSRTIMLVGSESEIVGFLDRHRPEQCGLKVVGASVLRDTAENLDDDLALAVATARMSPPDDIFLLIPWGDADLLASCVDMFRRLPSDIHLGPSAFLQRYGDMRVDHSGPISSVHLVRSPLSAFDILLKRSFDVALASLALVLLGPVLALAALAIKLESRGPVFFTQRRYGFNQQPFRIYKFRSMHTMEDNAQLTQVTRGDRRVTGVGRILRMTSIDELPQLLNVLKGDMSIVGPRPHALAHDQRFERSIASYARRHNVRPGITGWAQVRGWRGETDTPEKIKARVDHDIQYIDNWSFWFDLSIILRTVFSPQTFHNAR